MKKAIFIMVLIALTVSCAGCTPTRTVKDQEIVDFNIELTSQFSEVTTINTYIRRPILHWDVYVSDAAHMDDIFQNIVKYLKTSNIYENKIKDEYTGKLLTLGITITLNNKEVVRRYTGFYHSQDPSASGKIDNFTTWSISEERGHYGSSSKIGTYEYKED